MEEVILQQIESLEMIFNSQQRKLDIAISHLNKLADIDKKLTIFGSLSEEQQLDKQIILSQYERD